MITVTENLITLSCENYRLYGMYHGGSVIEEKQICRFQPVGEAIEVLEVLLEQQQEGAAQA